MPFFVQLWLFATPVIYPSSVVKTPWKRLLLDVNPMAGVLDAFRWCVLGRPTLGPGLLLSVSIVVILFVTALYHFRALEKSFADRI
jgi:lipopolysaccharide transport system permease protein